MIEIDKRFDSELKDVIEKFWKEGIHLAVIIARLEVLKYEIIIAQYDNAPLEVFALANR